MATFSFCTIFTLWGLYWQKKNWVLRFLMPSWSPCIQNFFKDSVIINWPFLLLWSKVGTTSILCLGVKGDGPKNKNRKRTKNSISITYTFYLFPDLRDHLPSNFLKSPSTMEKWSSRIFSWAYRINNSYKQKLDKMDNVKFLNYNSNTILWNIW